VLRQAATFLAALYACLLFAFLALPDPTGILPVVVGLALGVPIGALAAWRATRPLRVVRVALASLVVLTLVTLLVGLPALVVSGATGLDLGADAVFGATPVTAGAVVLSVATGYWLVVRGGLARLLVRLRG
jgi:hypothetical protein